MPYNNFLEAEVKEMYFPRSPDLVSVVSRDSARRQISAQRSFCASPVMGTNRTGVISVVLSLPSFFSTS